MLAHYRRRKPARGAVRQIGVEGGIEGKGRVFTPKRGQARSKTCRHDGFAKAVDLELPLLRRRQHKIATRGTVAALI